MCVLMEFVEDLSKLSSVSPFAFNGTARILRG